ncbi:uncharacterized protein [Coffea arabica]|uniref:Endonuclease/exonuclease/phosphatase domain-containing protein n=1 Tax=Coffea arabica TaxID=13443 RepID=A0ABM4VQQ8_COFAR
MKKFKKRVNYDNIFVVNPIGKAGGLAIFWNKDLKIDKILFTKFTIEVKIAANQESDNWWCICTYANSMASIRQKQWENLSDRKRLWNNRIVLIGDFNDIISNDEKWGGKTGESWSFSKFKNFITRNKLIDLGFEGLPWTWNNNWSSGEKIKERLDRALTSVEWCKNNSGANLMHIQTVASDHAMLLMDTRPVRKRYRKRFQFDARWLQYPEVEKVVDSAWEKQQLGSRGYRITRKIKECILALKGWNKGLQSNSKAKILAIKDLIGKTQERNTQNKQSLIMDLKRKLSAEYAKEEAFWAQKSRCKWLKEGDKNTAYFHMRVASKRRRNRISRLEKEQGGWCETDEEIGEEVTRYYQKLFKSTWPTNFDEILQGISRTITEQMNLQITRLVIEKEIKLALFSMHPNKAPDH